MWSEENLLNNMSFTSHPCLCYVWDLLSLLFPRKILAREKGWAVLLIFFYPLKQQVIPRLTSRYQYFLNTLKGKRAISKVTVFKHGY